MSKILIVDDEEQILFIIEMMIDSVFEELTFLKASNGLEAIEILKEHSDIKVIVSDYSMPKMNGGGLYNYNKENSKIPFVLVTGGYIDDYPEFTTFKNDNPLNVSVTKPVKEDVLIEGLRNILEAPKPESSDVEGKKAKVVIDNFIKSSFCNIPVFLALASGKYVKIFDSYESSDKDQIEKYKDKGEEYIYLEYEDFSKSINNMFEKVFKDLENTTGEDSIKAGTLGMELLFNGTEALGIDEKQVKFLDTYIKKCVDHIESNDSIKPFFMDLMKGKGYALGHSLTSLHLAYLMASKVGISEEKKIISLCFASLLQNVLVSEDKLAEILDLEDKRYECLSDEEKRKVKNHPKEMSEIMSKAGKIPFEAIKLVEEHHEKPDGSGFPTKLNDSSLGPLSSLFILAVRAADWMSQYSLDSEESKMQFKMFLDDEYDKGYFKEPKDAILKILLES